MSNLQPDFIHEGKRLSQYPEWYQKFVRSRLRDNCIPKSYYDFVMEGLQ